MWQIVVSGHDDKNSMSSLMVKYACIPLVSIIIITTSFIKVIISENLQELK